MTTKTLITRVAAGAVALVSVAALAACGGGSNATTSAAGATSSPNPTSTSSTGTGGTGDGQGRRGGFLDAATRTKVTACLKAAGIAVPTFTGRPTDGARPTGAPNGTPPSGFPTNGARPTGAPGRAGGGFGVFGSAEAQAALKACGITLPSRPAGAPTGAPTGAPAPTS